MTDTIDRFDLESQIMNCWNVVDDLKMLVDLKGGSTENIQALARVYQMKFELLSATFEKLVAQGKVT